MKVKDLNQQLSLELWLKEEFEREKAFQNKPEFYNLKNLGVKFSSRKICEVNYD